MGNKFPIEDKSLLDQIVARLDPSGGNDTTRIMLLLLLLLSRFSCVDSVRPHRRQPTRLPCPWDSPGKNTGVGCHFLLQGIFPTQGSNRGLLRCRQTLYPPSHHKSDSLFHPPDYQIIIKIESTVLLGLICEILGLI